MTKAKPIEASNFIEKFINEDIENGVYDVIHTRFPPEPNGFLHIGHVKAVMIDFGTAKKYQGMCNLRFDDTNPDAEDDEFVESIKNDIHWLGFDWQDRLYFCSDYFQQIYEIAVNMIKNGDAYVDHCSKEEIRENRGSFTKPGIDSPYRNRSVEENLMLFNKMKNGEFGEGQCVLRAKIDMQSPNLNMRDPVMYRISYTTHHRTGDKWCIYPMYDFSHPLGDAFEGVSHSLCSKEYEDHRPLYNWFVNHSGVEHKPRQIEFARINVTNALTSKRKIKQLTELGLVEDWTDPRLVTVSGLRRRGYTANALLNFVKAAGVAKADSVVDFSMLEYEIREDLKQKSPCVMAVLRPLKVTITNYPESVTEQLEGDNNPKNQELGKRQISFGKNIYIDRKDFTENPPKKYKRLAPGLEVRLKHAYFIKCNEVVKDPHTGEVIELLCTYDKQTKSGSGFKDRKPNGTIHWVHADSCQEIEVRIFNNLFKEGQENNSNLHEAINPESRIVLPNACIEKGYKDININDRYQFIRDGYYVIEKNDNNKIIFNKIVSLKSNWKKK
ncbi:glutamine--tRNA ligase/YqeY domain fusion protein [Clostridium sp. 'deep sea']|uniref:glutamine--tRNA ligase/YqeY domain fusion protein n=1 Tax=Clostridium sp. 'deep sea' TaxID=2779445 RepID=UPI00189658F1|nr:glutamine--tRNA ligase/YqeY domain fusion protein [Clostridium sp. 'deep sea']QOR34480.1 glutamine--tRNA ligase/YqeY domain fusion protein [Clostridium sp. 'deep sea']